MVKRIVLMVVLVLMTLGFISNANSYTNATVKSNAKIKIAESENALIAVPKEIRVVSENEYFKAIKVLIKNNMNKKITVSLDKADSFGDEVEKITLNPGQDTMTDIIVGRKPNKDKEGYYITFNAEWQGGSAKIKSYITDIPLENLKNPVQENKTDEVKDSTEEKVSEEVKTPVENEAPKEVIAPEEGIPIEEDITSGNQENPDKEDTLGSGDSVDIAGGN